MKSVLNMRLIIFGLILIFGACTNESNKKSEAELLLEKVTNQNRFFSTDQIAKRIINDDPSLVLIDVRSLYDFEEYSLPNAISIPSDELFLEENKVHLETDFQDIVLFSNDDIYADQSWYFLTKKGYENIYVMKGGVNNWFSTIMLPQEPSPGSPKDELDLYSFRKGASIYFGGSHPEIPAVVENDKTEKTIPPKKKEVKVQKKVKKQAEGGC